MTTVDIKKLFNYWHTETDISWDVADSLLKNNKYSEALFFGHLAVEKILQDEIEFFSKFYLSCRYDNYKMDFRKQCTKKFTEENMAKIKQYYLWLKKEAENKYRTR